MKQVFLEEKEGKEEETQLVQDWNSLVECIVKAEKLWNGALQGFPSGGIEIEGIGIPKLYANYRMSNFTNFLTRFLASAKGSGGVETMFAKL